MTLVTIVKGLNYVEQHMYDIFFNVICDHLYEFHNLCYNSYNVI